jgi:hypothetical protein
MSSSIISKLVVGVALILGCGDPAPTGPSSSEPIPLLVAQGQPGELRHFPFSFDLPAGGTAVAYSVHRDAVLPSPVDAVSLIDGGTVTNPNFYLSSITAVGDSLYGVSYITGAVDAGSERAYGWVSHDSGATWQPRVGTLTLPEPPKSRDAGWGGLLFHRRLHAGPGGQLRGTLYGNYASDPDWYTTVWAESPDMGLTWQVLSTVAAGPAGREGYAEPVSVLCPDGSILVVMRTGGDTPMQWSRSQDAGKTWSSSVELPWVGWDPDLYLTDGFLYLSHGQPGRLWVHRSADCGESWSDVFSLELPTTSGYTGLGHVRGRLAVFTDAESETQIRAYFLDDKTR